MLKGIDYFTQSVCRIKVETGETITLKGTLLSDREHQSKLINKLKLPSVCPIMEELIAKMKVESA